MEKRKLFKWQIAAMERMVAMDNLQLLDYVLNLARIPGGLSGHSIWEYAEAFRILEKRIGPGGEHE